MTSMGPYLGDLLINGAQPRAEVGAARRAESSVDERRGNRIVTDSDPHPRLSWNCLAKFRRSG
jgi:hypothetical protein